MIHDEPLSTVADALRTGEIEPAAYLETIRERSETVDPEIEAFVDGPGRWDRAFETAEKLTENYPCSADRPPLFGVPIGVKDIFHVDGMKTRAGSELPPEALAGEEAAAVTALTSAGAIVLGKTVTTEFACFEPGPTRNPHNIDHTPGGSSSGSAAAVASGLCPLAFGTQTIGSTIRPAAFCGIVGFVASHGRIPTDGVIPVSESLDHVGIFTQDTEGIELVAPLLCESWRTLPSPTARPTLGIPRGPYLEQASGVARESFDESVSALRTAGYDVGDVQLLDDIETINERHERLMAAEAAIVHDEWYEAHRERYSEQFLELLETGRTVPTADVAAATRSRPELRSRLARAMDDRGIDLWIAPASTGPAPEGIDSTGDPIMNLPWTHAGVPTVGLPSDTAEGLPLGVQCIGRYGADEDVVRWSHGLADALSA